MAPVPYPARTYSVIHTGILSPVKGELSYKFALRSKYHERNTEYGIGTCGEDGETLVGTVYAELHLRTFRASYPVALCLLDGVSPLYRLQTIEQTL